MTQRSLLEARPVIRAFYQVIPAVIKKGVYVSGPEGRPSDAFIYVLEGAVHYDLPHGAMDVSPGDFFHFARHSVYTMTVKSDAYRVIIVNFDLDTTDRLKSLKARSPGAESCFQRLLSRWQAQGMAVREDCMALTYTLYSEIITAADSPFPSASNRRRINAALLYIGRHLHEESLSVPQIARRTGLSESHFRRSFREVTGLSPLKYIQRQRLQLARERLRYSDDPIGCIAESLGFASAYHFSHAFKKETGVSPREYRRQHSRSPQT